MLNDLTTTYMRRAAWLFLLGMVNGAWAGIVMTNGKAIGLTLNLHPQHERLVLAAHLNALLGTFWLLGVAFTLPYLRFAERGMTWLCRTVTLATFGNWSVTLLASLLDVRGLAFDRDPRNDLIAGLLQVAVVIPTFVAATMWVYGLYGRNHSSQSTGS